MSLKLFVLKNIPVRLIANFVKVIHIELADERSIIAMPEVDGKNFLLELLNIIDNESGAVGIPSNDVFELLVLNRKFVNLQDLKCLRDEDRWAGHPLPSCL